LIGVYIQGILFELPPLAIKLIVLLIFYSILKYVFQKQDKDQEQAQFLLLNKLAVFIVIRDVVFTGLRIALYLNEYRYYVMLLLAISDVFIIHLWIYWVSYYTKKELL